MWPAIIQDKPNVWVWLGDNIYGDSEDMAVLKAKYDAQLNQEGYKQLISQVPVIGTWDDHDFGKNDGNKTYPKKKESQQLALDFFGEPANSPRRKQEGIYAAYDYKVGKKTVKVILLDVRYHQDQLQRENGKYLPSEGDILGEVQWQWLQNQLQNSKADAHIIGTGIQIVPDNFPSEKWANFPNAKKRFYDLLAATKPKGVMLIAGDRHIGEFSRVNIPGLEQPVFEITSSGLTHTTTTNSEAKYPSAYRVGPLVTLKNYGLFRFRDAGKKLVAEVSIKGEKGEAFHTEKFEF
ncbi:hypothetical protein AAE02nite_41560 [Adhaeribacter aerolatus]|uniref:PhoD-like phosphatase metallophosphatase domain-containing protein n=1 Tax=Adhaeribacter aerolatus TaxID=670289 RepID=A0A512B3G2_9BACT|nr:alkaline phosphatase D family protein [Adhaeribacter aerolatus]GEO06492.1 hypothetical protein AAE02nite_41560 [Adhaeribacter aerolatus]